MSEAAEIQAVLTEATRRFGISMQAWRDQMEAFARDVNDGTHPLLPSGVRTCHEEETT